MALVSLLFSKLWLFLAELAGPGVVYIWVSFAVLRSLATDRLCAVGFIVAVWQIMCFDYFHRQIHTLLYYTSLNTVTDSGRTKGSDVFPFFMYFSRDFD